MEHNSGAIRAKHVLLGLGVLALGLAGLLFFVFRNERRLIDHAVRTTGVVKARFQMVKGGSKPVPITATDSEGEQYSIDLMAKWGKITVEFQDERSKTHVVDLQTGALEVVGYREGSRVAIVYLPEDPSVAELAKTVAQGRSGTAMKMVYVCLGAAVLFLGLGSLLALRRFTPENPEVAEKGKT